MRSSKSLERCGTVARWFRHSRSARHMYLTETNMPVTIRSAKTLWIDADPVFGGSASQVQFPAELAAFFDLPMRPRIGRWVRRSVISAGLTHRPKKMDFHHNAVWRMNLPTARQGLGGYRGQLLVFRKDSRRARWYLWIIDRRSAPARVLRKTSRQSGSIGWKYRENRTKRSFGFF